MSTPRRLLVSDLPRLCHYVRCIPSGRDGKIMVHEEQAVSAEAVRAELRRILTSPRFDASERNRSFLTFVVEESLAGRTDRIKAYSIATGVFGREPTFDPQLDSIVRIEAGRLRRSLERYYLTDGLGAQFRIDIPRGRYVPVFGALRPEPPRTAARRTPTVLPPTVLVTAFEAEGDQSSFPSFTRGFTRSLIIALTRFTNLRVFGLEAAMRQPAEVDPGGLHRAPAFDYVVTGQTSLAPDSFQVDALLVEADCGRAVWADTFERSLQPSEIIKLRNDVSNQIARALAQPYGAIQSDRACDMDRKSSKAFDSHAAVSLFYAYWRTFDPSMIEQVRVGLERAVALDPGYSEAHACLSLVYCNAFRFQHPIGAKGADDPLGYAVELADRAIELAPGSAWARYALGLAHWFSGDFCAGLEALEKARAINPNDTTILADLGQRYAMLARWEDALPLLSESYASNPAQPGGYRIGLFLYHYAHGRFAEALKEARQVNAPQVLYGHIAEAAAEAELGRKTEAAAAVARVLTLDPDYGAKAVTDLKGRGVAPGLVQALAISLAKAGLRVCGPPAAETSLVGSSTCSAPAFRHQQGRNRGAGD
jgi:TolB-like protein